MGAEGRLESGASRSRRRETRARARERNPTNMEAEEKKVSHHHPHVRHVKPSILGSHVHQTGECTAGQTRAGQTVNPEFDGLFLSYRIMHISDYPPYRFGGSRIRHLLLFPPTRCARRRRVRRILGGKCYHLTKPSFEMVLQAHLSPMGINALRRGSLFLHHRAQLESILWLAQESFQPIAVRCFSSTSRSRTLVSDDDVT